MRNAILLLFLVLVCTCLVRAAGLGTVVYVKVVGSGADAPADVYQRALPDGTAVLLIARAALPADFQGRIDNALPSADGDYLLLQESMGVVIRDTTTGVTRQVFGNGYSMNAHEKLDRTIGSRCWLWTRATGAYRLADFATPDLRWSPSGHLLLALISGAHAGIHIYNPDNDTTHILLELANPGMAAWMADGSGALVTEATAGGGARITAAPLKGKARLCFTWPRAVLALAPAADGKHIAVADANGVAIVTDAGRVLATSREVTPSAEQTDLRFSPTGEQLAIFVSHATGEPHIFIHEALYTLDAATGATARVAAWEERLGGDSDTSTLRSLLGWAPDAPALLLAGKAGTVSSADTYWRKLWLQPLDPAKPATLLFDSGPGVVDLAWRAGQ